MDVTAPRGTGLLIYSASFQKQIQPQRTADTSLKSSARERKMVEIEIWREGGQPENSVRSFLVWGKCYEVINYPGHTSSQDISTDYIFVVKVGSLLISN